MSVKPQIINDHNGHPIFAVLSWGDYVNLAETGVREKRELNQFPVRVRDRLLSSENPVKVFRELRKLTQDELAHAIGTTPGYLSQIETNRRKGSTALLRRVANALDVNLDILVD